MWNKFDSLLFFLWLPIFFMAVAIIFQQLVAIIFEVFDMGPWYFWLRLSRRKSLMISMNLKQKLTIFCQRSNVLSYLRTATAKKVNLHQQILPSMCRILKSSFNNRQRRIESLRSFSNLFFKLLHYYSIKRMYQIHEAGDRRSIHKKCITPKEKTSLIIRRRWG